MARAKLKSRLAKLLSDYTVQRSLAVSYFFVREASNSRDVRDFRNEMFGGVTLSRAQAVKLLHSPAPRILSVDDFASLGVPIVGHWARIVGTRGLSWQRSVAYQALALRIKWPGHACQTIARRIGDLWSDDWDLSLEFPGRGNIDECRVDVWPLSVFNRLAIISKSLTIDYPWKPTEAVWFVLTGQMPYVIPVDIDTGPIVHGSYRGKRITLSIETWVPADDVMRTYRYLQTAALDGDNRPITVRNLRLFEFVVQQRIDNPGQTWRQRMQLWNEINPQWAYAEGQ